MKRLTSLLPFILASSAMIMVVPGLASDYTLGIYGNANMDDIINEEDKAYTEDIIKGTNEETKLADANYDGLIDEDDISQIENIINGVETEITFIDSVEILTDPKSIHLFKTLGVYNEKELSARRSILEEQYTKTVEIEARTLVEMTRKDVLPAMCKEYRFYAEAGTSSKYMAAKAKTLDHLISSADDAAVRLVDRLDKVLQDADCYKTGKDVYDTVCPLMKELRSYLDAYDKDADPSVFTLPTYEDMLFSL